MTSKIELEIGSGATPGEFSVRVITAPSGGEPAAAMHLDVDRLLAGRDELAALVLRSAAAGDSLAEGQLREVGTRLFDALFAGQIYGTYRASLGVARERNERLRVVLRLTAPPLVALPWEALFDSETGANVCLRESLVRHAAAPFTSDPVEVELPLRILAVVAAPQNLQGLDISTERERLNAALAGPIAQGLIELDWLEPATWEGVQQKLLSAPWHVLHFIGHGGYDVTADEGIIELVDAAGTAHAVDAARLADLLNEAQPKPPLVVLNSCSSGAGGPVDLFSGTAAALVRSGIGAVAAMQFTISDPAAIAFSAGFYTALANGHSVDDAVRSGRVSILGEQDTLEWVTPVLYLRGDTTELFSIRTPPPPAVREQPAGNKRGPEPPVLEPVCDAFFSYTHRDDEYFGGAISGLKQLLELGVQVVTGDESFNIFQDVEDIELGRPWQHELDRAISSSTLLIPIVTPLYFNSEPCRDELARFIEHEKRLGRDDLILPIYFVDAPVLERNDLLAKDPLAGELAKRQRYDFRVQADLPRDDPEKRRAVSALAKQVAAAIARSTGLEVAAAPADLGADAKADVATALNTLAAERAPDKVRRQVLWVDDRPDNNVIERRSMEPYNIDFVLAGSTGKALAQLRTGHFDAIISDMGRPPDPRAGYTLLEALRDSGDQTPYFIYAGSRKPEHIREALDRGAQGTTNLGDELLRMILKSVDS
jgi:CheY-like chemotaxis protein